MVVMVVWSPQRNANSFMDKPAFDLPPLVLASASPRRSQLLRQLELNFQVIPVSAPEVQSEHLTPRETCLINAYRKARIVAKDHPDCLVLGADTVVSINGKFFGKPANKTEASRMLAELQGHTHAVTTGVCLIHLRTHHQLLFAESSLVTLRHLETFNIERYHSLVDPLDKAGAYAIQEFGDMIVEEVKGSISNVVGLPLERLSAALEQWPASAATPG
jgi:septum formation protein